MIIQGMVDSCDFRGTTYDSPQLGGHVLCRGATGRVCCVMYMGMEEFEEGNYEFNTRAQAEEWAENYTNGSVDF